MRKQLSLRAAKQAGFTLIELIIVIVIIGILAAVAVPKYQSLTNDANTAAVQGVAGNLASASALNYALSSAGKASSVAGCDSTGGSNGVGALLQSGMPTGFTSSGTGTSCVVSGPTGASAAWVASH